MAEAVLLRELILIRHGESYANINITADSFTDEQDPLLTDKGLEQAELLGRFLADEELSAVYSGGLRRVVLTADGIIRHRKEKTPLLILPELCEIGVSPDYPGQSYDELKKLCPAAVPAPGVDENEKTVVPDECTYEHEERYFARAERILGYMDTHYRNGEKVAVVSHAGFLTYIIFYLMGYRDAEPGYDFRISNTGITRILFYEPGTNKYGDVVFDCVNERKHLS